MTKKKESGKRLSYKVILVVIIVFPLAYSFIFSVGLPSDMTYYDSDTGFEYNITPLECTIAYLVLQALLYSLAFEKRTSHIHFLSIGYLTTAYSLLLFRLNTMWWGIGLAGLYIFLLWAPTIKYKIFGR